jgi:branched-chain amino acid transport system substrate-binding protein
MYFPQMTVGHFIPAAILIAVKTLAVPQGKSKFASLVCIEVATCTSIGKAIPGIAPKYGIQVVYQGSTSFATPDFTSYCQSMQQAGAQVVLIGLETNSIRRMISNCGNIGFHPLFMSSMVQVTPDLAKDPKADGFIIDSLVAPYNDTSNPQVAAMQQAFKQYSPGVTPDFTTLVGWTSATLFGAAAAHDPKALTSQSILQGLWSIKNNDLGGITAPLTFNQGQNAPGGQSCVWSLAAKNGVFQQTGPPGRQCDAA